MATSLGEGFATTHAPPPHVHVRPRTEASERRCINNTRRLTFTMGKKSREKRAKQIERDRNREGGGAGPSSSSGAPTSRVAEQEQEETPPDHRNTPAAAAAKPSTDDTHDDEPASTAASASDSTAAVAEKLLTFSHSCVHRLGEDIKTWVDGKFSRDVNVVKAAAERGDAKAQYAVGFMMAYDLIPGDAGDGVTWLRKAAAQGYADACLAMGLMGVEAVVLGNCRKVTRKR